MGNTMHTVTPVDTKMKEQRTREAKYLVAKGVTSPAFSEIKEKYPFIKQWCKKDLQSLHEVLASHTYSVVYSPIDIQPGDIMILPPDSQFPFGHAQLVCGYPFLQQSDNHVERWYIKTVHCLNTGCEYTLASPFPVDKDIDIIRFASWNVIPTTRQHVIVLVIAIGKNLALRNISFPSVCKLVKSSLKQCFSEHEPTKNMLDFARQFRKMDTSLWSPCDTKSAFVTDEDVSDNNFSQLFCSEFVLLVWQLAISLTQLPFKEILPGNAQFCHPKDLLQLPAHFPQY